MNEKQMEQIAKRVLEGMHINNSTGRWCLGVLMDAGVVKWDSEEGKYVQNFNVQFEENFSGWEAKVYIDERAAGNVFYSQHGELRLEIIDGLSLAEENVIVSECTRHYGKEFKKRPVGRTYQHTDEEVFGKLFGNDKHLCKNTYYPAIIQELLEKGVGKIEFTGECVDLFNKLMSHKYVGLNLASSNISSELTISYKLLGVEFVLIPKEKQ